MKKRTCFWAFVFILVLALNLTLSMPAGAQMIKEVVMGLFLDAPSEVDADRYYLRYHAPEAISHAGDRLRKYEMYRPYDPPEEAVERFGAVKGRYAELWFASEEDYHSRPSNGAWTLPDWEEDRSRRMPKGGKIPNTVPALPTEEFYNPDLNPEKIPVIRWMTAIKYPDGVSVEEGEKWFLETHAKEVLKQPGLLKFISYKCLERGGGPPGSGGMPSMPGGRSSMPEGMPPSEGMAPPSGRGDAPPGGMTSWVRINEYWYNDLAAWRKAVIESPPEYTAPPWGGEYPFVEMGSTFINYKPDVDFLKGDYIIP